MTESVCSHLRVLTHVYGEVSYSFEVDYVHIHSLYVIPEFRRKGYGKKLLLEAISEIRNSGHNDEIMIVTRPTKDTDISRSKLKSFYKSLGLTVYSFYK